MSVKRGLDVRDFMLTTFGGSGSLLACRLVDILDLAGVVVPQNPGNVSAFGLLTVDVKNDYVQTMVSKHAALDHAAVQKTFDQLTDKAAKALDGEGFPRDAHRYTRTVDLRYFGQAFEVRVAAPEGTVDEAYAAHVAEAFHEAHRALYGYDFRADPSQQVEWVNLRVTGVGPITRPELRDLEPAACQSRAASRRRVIDRGRSPKTREHAGRSASTPTTATPTPRSTGGRTCSPATRSAGRRSSRSSARPFRSTPASPSASTRSATW